MVVAILKTNFRCQYFLQFTAVCVVPLSPTLTLFEERVNYKSINRCRIGQLYRYYVCTVRTDRKPLFLVPTSNPIISCLMFLSYHRKNDIDRFLATTPFLIVLLLFLSAISYGSLFLIFSKIEGLISYKLNVFLL